MELCFSYKEDSQNMELCISYKGKTPSMELCFSYEERTPRIWSYAFLIKRGLPKYGALLFL